MNENTLYRIAGATILSSSVIVPLSVSISMLFLIGVPLIFALSYFIIHKLTSAIEETKKIQEDILMEEHRRTKELVDAEKKNKADAEKAAAELKELEERRLSEVIEMRKLQEDKILADEKFKEETLRTMQGNEYKYGYPAICNCGHPMPIVIDFLSPFTECTCKNCQTAYRLDYQFKLTTLTRIS